MARRWQLAEAAKMATTPPPQIQTAGQPKGRAALVAQLT
jgi:hypothetical protein